MYELAINSPTLVELKVEAFWSRRQARFLGEPSGKPINESAAAVLQIHKRKPRQFEAEGSIEYGWLFLIKLLLYPEEKGAKDYKSDD